MMNGALVRGRTQRGQTLVIAIIVMVVLLVLGLVFLGIVNRNIQSSSRQIKRSLAENLADSGLRYAHSQLLTSGLGADWRPVPANFTDPNAVDYDYLKTGGPDGEGAFSRIKFENGRALIRVRYAPADPSLYAGNQSGASLAHPAKTRSFLIVEAVGRAGAVNDSDPTQRKAATTVDQRKKIAMVSIGLIESARFITNKYSVSRPAELGVPDDLGLLYQGTNVSFPLSIGGSATTYGFGGGTGTTSISGFGSIYSNADLKLYGTTQVSLARALGDQIAVAGNILGAEDTSKLVMSVVDQSGAAWTAPTVSTYTNASTPSLNSQTTAFDTNGGVLRDGAATTDDNGYARGVPRKEPPSILVSDPDTGVNRYVRMTRDSGPLVNGGLSGRYGYGEGIYVGNFDDRQIPADETGRQNVGTSESLVYDWLNPNNGQSGSGWQGSFYVPRGSYLRLLSDGFAITLDGRAPANQRTWKLPDGTDTGKATIRYRVGASNRKLYIVNSFTAGVDIAAASSSIDFSKGEPFNGVLYFEGNVRVRGESPTDVPLTIVSGATIYVEGSITKGVVANNWSANQPTYYSSDPVTSDGQLLSRPTRASVGLLAKDYVCLNTTQFFGPDPDQALEPVQDVPTAVGFNPVRMRDPGNSLTFLTELLLNPAAAPDNPSSWTPFSSGYTQFSAGTAIPQNLVLTHTMDDGPGPFTFFQMDLNPGLGTSNYLFPASAYNGATTYYGTASPTIPLYGLGGESWQRYSKFESTAFPIFDSTSAFVSAGRTLQAPTAQGSYDGLVQETNQFRLAPNTVGGVATNDYLLARAALVPQDIRIEATMYAEEGSFFVIPGPWFNPNPNDTRANYATLGSTAAERQLARYEDFGAGPNTPFYGEPLDVRIEIIGAVSENMPPPMAIQAEYLRKWGWIPSFLDAEGTTYIPASHAGGQNLATPGVVAPNLIFTYDPVLATGHSGTGVNNPVVRIDDYGRPLPPLPRLPVSPAISFVGDVSQ